MKPEESLPHLMAATPAKNAILLQRFGVSLSASRIQVLTERLGENHPEVIALREQMRQQMQAMADAPVPPTIALLQRIAAALDKQEQETR